MCIYFVLIILLAAAAAMDFRFNKIFNEWILFIFITGISWNILENGIAGGMEAIAAITIPVILLYPLFMIGGLGAGDVKLLAAIGSFCTIREILICLAVSFLIGAVLSLLKMIAEGSLLHRLKYLLSYIRDVFSKGEWKLYEHNIHNKQKTNEGKIHFSLPVLLAVIILKGGIF